MKINLGDLTCIITFENKQEEKIIKKEITFKDDKNAFFGGRFHPERIKDVCLGKDIRGYFVCFAGLAREIIIAAKNNNIKITEFTDKRTHFPFQDKEWTHDELRKYFDPNFKYVEHQIRALRAMINTNTGIIKAPTSAGKCCEGNTKIIIDGKETKIKNLFKDFQEEEVRRPEKKIFVLTENGYQEIEALYKTNKRKVLKLTLENGYSIIAVPEHRVLTDSGWKKLEDLKKGDKVLCEKEKKSFWKEKNMLSFLVYHLKSFFIWLLKKIYSKL